jgi:ABC-type cobalamin/Fe3+-siderophores transport system ATPase subunit
VGPKEVLADVWGIAQPGEMQALLGPSGAGKSTFMVRAVAAGVRAAAALLGSASAAEVAKAWRSRCSPHLPTSTPRASRNRPPPPLPTPQDILALRKSVGNLTGRILVNGQRASKKFIRKTAYVPQEDNFVPTMTTWEVMSFYADVSPRAVGGGGGVRG